MTDNALVQVRIDPEIRDKASEVLARSGLTVSDLVRIILTRTANDNAIPLGLVGEDREYDAWFRARVQEAIDDPRPRIPHEVVKAEFAVLRAELRAKIEAGNK
jgi:DNA-damage-inducible protein J